MFPLRDTERSLTFPLVTVLIMIANALCFLVELSFDPVTLNDFLFDFGVVPTHWHWWSLITNQFLHGGWAHLLLNMWTFWIYGDNVEDRLGRGRYLALYLAAGVAGSLAQIASNPQSAIPTIGASGAIAGVMGAYVVMFPHARVLMFTFPFFLFEVPAALVIGGWIVLQLFAGFGSLADTSSGGVAFWAHVGGFAAGLILVKLFTPKPKYYARPEFRW